jgi:multidrug resistance efflux pump
MRDAGFRDFERGELGSTAEHLSVLEYKTKKEEERAAAVAAEADEKQKTVAALDETTAQKQGQLASLDKAFTVKKRENVTVAEIEKMAKPTLFGSNLSIAQTDWDKVKNLAKEGLKSRGIISRLRKRVDKLLVEIRNLKDEIKKLGGRQSITGGLEYYKAKQRAPRRLAEVIADIFRKPPEKPAPEHSAPEKVKAAERGL